MIHMINIGIDAFLDSQPETVKVKKERHNCTGCAMVFDTVKGVRSHFIRSHRPKAKRWIPKVFKPLLLTRSSILRTYGKKSSNENVPPAALEDASSLPNPPKSNIPPGEK